MSARKSRSIGTFVPIIVLGLIVVLTVSPRTLAADPYLGTVLSNNGTLSSSPPGSGDVDVLFQHVGLTLGPHRATYNEIATNHVVYRYDLEPAPDLRLFASAFIINNTGVPWAGFEILLEGADFAGQLVGVPLQAPASNPVVDIGLSSIGLLDIGLEEIGIRHNIPGNFTLASSTISRFNDQGSGFRDARLTFLFGQPYASGNGAFDLIYNIFPSPGALGNTSFSIFLTPIPVPEPASAVLLGVGLIGFVRRQRKHT